MRLRYWIGVRDQEGVIKSGEDQVGSPRCHLFGSVAGLLFEMLFQQLQRVGVALEAFAGDGGEAGQAGVAHLAEVLARLYGADVYLDGRDGDGLEGIEDCHTRMRVCRRVDDYAVDLAVGLLDLVDDAAFVVRLEDLDLVEALCGARFLADLH